MGYWKKDIRLFKQKDMILTSMEKKNFQGCWCRKYNMFNIYDKLKKYRILPTKIKT